MGAEDEELVTSPDKLVEELRELRRLEAEKRHVPPSSSRFQQLVTAIGDKSRQIMGRTILHGDAADGQKLPERRYGPKTPEVTAFIDRVRRLTAEEGAAIRHAYVNREQPPDVAGTTRAEITLAVIRTAVDADLKDEHRLAIEDCRRALSGSPARANGMSIHLGDLAGALVVRDRLDPGKFDYMAAGWREAFADRGDTIRL